MQQATEPLPPAVKVARAGLILGPLGLLTCVLSEPPGGLSAEAWATLGLALLMAIWWASEAIPLPATALLPIVLIPALGIDSLQAASTPYAHPTIFLFLGGFILGMAMQRCQLHRRIALLILLAAGPQPRHQIGGFMLATAFLSMWVSNTATTIMMLPIGLSLIALRSTGHEAGEMAHGIERFATALLLAIAYSASVGGIATLIGTPPNALLAAFLQENYGLRIGFAQWLLLGLPMALSMLALIWWWLTRKAFDLPAASGAPLLRQQLSELGPLSTGERRVALVFAATALAWIFQPLIGAYLAGISDTSIALAAAIALFIIPLDARARTFLMDWPSAVQLPWGILLLFGGGLSLAAAIGNSGLAAWIAQSMGTFASLPALLVLAMVVLVVIFLTELTSNTATAAAFLPLLGALAVAQGLPPQMLAIPAAIAASCAFMMPVATPPNAIVFGSGHLRIQAMIRAGFALNLISVALISLLCYGLVELIWPA